jgi:hypothetical protein
MRSVKQWLAAAFVVAALTGTAAIVEFASSSKVVGQERGPDDHWRHHDGHWSQWNAADQRWYYTDGTHWFYNAGNGWRLYRFDAAFGRGFVHGEYKVPREEVKVVVPRHGIYIR